MLNVKVDFKNKRGRFLDSQMVNKLLIHRKDSSFLLTEDMVDLKIFEENQFAIKIAEIFVKFERVFGFSCYSA